MRWQNMIIPALSAGAGIIIGASLSGDGDAGDLSRIEERLSKLERRSANDDTAARIEAIETKLHDLERAPSTIPNDAGEVCSPLTISRAYWFDADERPSWIPAGAVKSDGSGYILIRVDEFRGEDGASQYEKFYSRADKMFALRARGLKEIIARAERGIWNQEFYVRVEPTDLNEVQAEVAYSLAPLNRDSPCQWQMRGEVSLTRSAEDHFERVAQ